MHPKYNGNMGYPLTVRYRKFYHMVTISLPWSDKNFTLQQDVFYHMVTVFLPAVYRILSTLENKPFNAQMHNTTSASQAESPGLEPKFQERQLDMDTYGSNLDIQKLRVT